MRIAPMKLKKEKRWNLKKIVPYVMMILMVGSALIAFTYNQGDSENFRLSVIVWNDFRGAYDVIFSNRFDYVGNTSALDLLRMTGMNVVYDNGTIDCVSAYCTYEKSWNFYVNNQIELTSPDIYIVEKDDEVVFAYE